MVLTRAQKEELVTELTQQMAKASSVMMAHYIGLTVSEVSDLRKQLRKGNAEMKVAKKTLMKIAAKDAGLPEVADEQLDGPVSLIFSFGDPLSGAQIAFKFAKSHDKVRLIGGIFDGNVLTKEQAMEFAKIPGREVLLAQFIGMVQSPLISFASMCNAPLGGFARALNQMAEKGGFAGVSASVPEQKVEVQEEVKQEEVKPDTPAETPTEPA